MGVADRVRLRPVDLGNGEATSQLVTEVRPNEIYNLAAQSSVARSFREPVGTAQVDAIGVANLLEAMRRSMPEAKLFQASSCEMFGQVDVPLQNEETPFAPRNPYGAAKLFAHHLVSIYRDAYGLHAVSGILFNHESPLRGESFVTRKITLGMARIRLGLQELLELGNLDAHKDWGFAGDFVEGMWRALQHRVAGDYVFATVPPIRFGTSSSRQRGAAGLSLSWRGEGLHEVGIGRWGRVIVRINPEFYRPLERVACAAMPARPQTSSTGARR